MIRKISANEVVVGLLSFHIVLILVILDMVLLFFQFELKMAVHVTLAKKKIYEVNNF